MHGQNRKDKDLPIDPVSLLYTDNHEWVYKTGEEIVVGLTDYAVELLGEVINVELPEPDPEHVYEIEEEVGVIEGTEDTWPLTVPVSGIITEVNEKLFSRPELINQDNYSKGWIFRMKPSDLDELDGLMDADEYEDSLPDMEEE